MNIRPDESGNGIDFYYDNEKVMDILAGLGLCIQMAVLKSVDSHDKDSVLFFKAGDKYYLIIKASDPDDPGLALGISGNILRFIEFIRHSTDELMEEQHRKILITELLDIYNNEENNEPKTEGEIRSWMV